MNIVDLDKLCEMFWDGNFMEIHEDDIPSIPSAFNGMTNGKVIQALFPNETMFEQTEACTYYGNMRFDTDWWNAPYKAESEVKANDK